MKRTSQIVAAAALAILLAGGYAVAQGHSCGQHQNHPDKVAHQEAAAAFVPLHGGEMMEAGGHHFETVVGDGEIRVYVYGEQHIPLPAAGLEGTASVSLARGGPRQAALRPAQPRQGEPAAYYCPMHAEATSTKPGECDLCGGMKLVPQDFLRAGLDLPQGAGEPTEVAVTVRGIGGEGKSVTFEQKLSPMVEVEAGKHHGGH